MVNTVTPAVSLPTFGPEDIAHLGQFAARLRISRGIENVAQLAEALNIADTSIGRFERGEIQTSAYFRLFVRALQNDRIGDTVVRSPLNSDEVDLLLDLEAQNSSPTRRRRRYEELNEIQLNSIQKPDGPIPPKRTPKKIRAKWVTYTEIVKALEKQKNPAFIADTLWHIHAINGAAFRLFGIDAESESGSEYLRQWEAWHVMAAKFTEPSPVRANTPEINRYFPPTVDAFFRDIYPYLFKPQVRALLGRLHAMSSQNGLGFGRMWESSVTLKSFIRQEKALYRAIDYQGKQTEAIAGKRTVWTVFPDGTCPVQHPVRYWMGVWKPNNRLNPQAKDVFMELQKFPDSRKIYYPVDYESVERPFHANRWPEVAAYSEVMQNLESGNDLDTTPSQGL